MQGLLDVLMGAVVTSLPWGQVKRVYILGDGKVALVDLPVEGYELPHSRFGFNPNPKNYS